MNTITPATAAGPRSTPDGSLVAPGLTSTAEQRVRALAPTVFCPAAEIEQCIERAQARSST